MIASRYTREAGVRQLERNYRQHRSQSGAEGSRRVALRRSLSLPAVCASIWDRLASIRSRRERNCPQVSPPAWPGRRWAAKFCLSRPRLLPGGRGLTITGQLGEVMQESIQAAMTVVRSRAAVLGLEPEFYQKSDVHIHVPEGATPKDGPSACGCARRSYPALAHPRARRRGHDPRGAPLRGEVLPIGGLKEKLLAAHRGGIRTVLIPDEEQ